jgi:hypothetical protein
LVEVEDEKVEAYWTCTLRVIVVSVNGEDGDGDIEIGVFVIDSREPEHEHQQPHHHPNEQLCGLTKIQAHFHPLDHSSTQTSHQLIDLS